MIDVVGVYKKYGREMILEDINVSFEQGVIYGLVGPNGCGKTTLMKCICGFSRISQGAITVEGKKIGKDVDFAPSTGVIIEEPGFLSQLSGEKNLMILANISNHASIERIHEVMRIMGLNPKEKKKVGSYSLGMRQRLGIAQAILEDPNNLILDEPFNGLDKRGTNDIHELLKKWKEEDKTIILASHSMADIKQSCDIVFSIENGKLQRTMEYN